MPDYEGRVEIIVNHHENDSVGKKRNELLLQANNEYVVFIDDDDDISPLYIECIMAAIKYRPDVVGFNGFMTTNGDNPLQFKISKNCDYVTHNMDGIRFFERCNNHLSPIKREIALAIGYKDMKAYEDFDYAIRLRDSGLIKTEVFINIELYHYQYAPKVKIKKPQRWATARGTRTRK